MIGLSLDNTTNPIKTTSVSECKGQGARTVWETGVKVAVDRIPCYKITWYKDP